MIHYTYYMHMFVLPVLPWIIDNEYLYYMHVFTFLFLMESAICTPFFAKLLHAFMLFDN